MVVLAVKCSLLTTQRAVQSEFQNTNKYHGFVSILKDLVISQELLKCWYVTFGLSSVSSPWMEALRWQRFSNKVK